MEIRKFECPGSMKPPTLSNKKLCPVCHIDAGLTLNNTVASHVTVETWLTRKEWEAML